ncbi:hypothetical protein MTO96_011693 [Rhipicephalus appendiculatus]
MFGWGTRLQGAIAFTPSGRGHQARAGDALKTDSRRCQRWPRAWRGDRRSLRTSELCSCPQAPFAQEATGSCHGEVWPLNLLGYHLHIHLATCADDRKIICRLTAWQPRSKASLYCGVVDTVGVKNKAGRGWSCMNALLDSVAGKDDWSLLRRLQG